MCAARVDVLCRVDPVTCWSWKDRCCYIHELSRVFEVLIFIPLPGKNWEEAMDSILSSLASSVPVSSGVRNLCTVVEHVYTFLQLHLREHLKRSSGKVRVKS